MFVIRFVELKHKRLLQAVESITDLNGGCGTRLLGTRFIRVAVEGYDETQAWTWGLRRHLTTLYGGVCKTCKRGVGNGAWDGVLVIIEQQAAELSGEKDVSRYWTGIWHSGVSQCAVVSFWNVRILWRFGCELTQAVRRTDPHLSTAEIRWRLL